MAINLSRDRLMQQKSIIVQGLHIRYYQSATFPSDGVLIFLHGWGSQASHFQKTLEQCDNYIAIDLPGFGGSEIPKTAWSIAEYAVFIREFIEKLGLRNIVLSGHSFGGSVAIKYAAQYDGVLKLILIDSAGVRRKTMKKRAWYIASKVFGIFLRIPFLKMFRDVVRSRLYRYIGSEDYIQSGALVEIYRRIIDEDLREDMKKIKVPTVLIWGENDKDTPLDDAKLIRDSIGNSKLRVIQEAGHFVFLDNERGFNSIFLDEIT